MCNGRRIRLRREARDESPARNSVSCESLQRYGVTIRGNVTSVDPPLVDLSLQVTKVGMLLSKV